MERLLDLEDEDLSSIENHPLFLSLKQEIEEEMLTSEENEELLCRYLESQGRHVSWKSNAESYGPSLLGIPTSLDAPHLACGMCGIKTVHGRYNRFCHVVPLKSLPKTISLTSQQLQEHDACKNRPPLWLPINDQGDFKDFHVHKLQSVYHSSVLNKHFHPHPELVHTVTSEGSDETAEATVLCPDCHC